MNVQKLESLPPPPGVIGSLRAGFDAVSRHVGLILLPLVLDIFLWLGPRLSVGKVYGSFAVDWLALINASSLPAQDLRKITENTSSMVDLLSRVNWLGWVRTIPIGIPSLMSGFTPEKLPLLTPLGLQDVIQTSSFIGMVGWIAMLTLIGWVGGGLYFRWVSETTLGEQEAGISSVRAIIQTFLLSVMWLVSLMLVSVPVVSVLAILMLINPALASGALLVMLIVSFWLMVPLFFTPHGIFVRRQNALYSVVTSLRMARFTLPVSSLFVFCVLILSSGLNYLWRVPPSDSWMTLVGIAGHAFITTALLAASFVYYRDMNVWLQTVLEQLQQKQSMPTRQA
jgi:hypothetical protein